MVRSGASRAEASHADGGVAVELALRDAARLIAERPCDTVPLGELARKLGLGKSVLSRKFKKSLGVGYRQAVQDSRITHARELLWMSRLTITEIAQAVGFGDLPRFDKVFKARFGMSPSRYRQQQTKRV